MQKVTGIPSDKINAFLSSCLSVHEKYYIMSLMGLSTGLRISDILKLTVKDGCKQSFSVTEQKTGKKKAVALPPALVKICRQYTKLNALRPSDCLIYSSAANKAKPLSRSQAYSVLKKVGSSLGLESIGCHSLRKTYAQIKFNQSHDINLVKSELNHDSINTTLLYLIDDFNALKL